MLDELLEAIGEPVTAGAEVGVEVLEPADAEKGVAQDEQRPAVTDDSTDADLSPVMVPACITESSILSPRALLPPSRSPVVRRSYP